MNTPPVRNQPVPRNPSRLIGLEKYKDERARNPNSIGILVEGDSWFNLHPLVGGSNLVIALKAIFGPKITILDLSKSGDEAREMLSGHQFKDLQDTLDKKGVTFDAILFSGGGNDLVGPNLLPLINSYADGMTAKDCIKEHRLGTRLDQIASAYQELTWLRDDHEKDAWIFTHGYDLAKPSGRGARLIVEVAGGWVKERLDSKGIPETLHSDIVKLLLEQFDKKIKTVMATSPKCVHVATQGTLTKDEHWGDELHPSENGFKLLAEKFANALREKFRDRL